MATTPSAPPEILPPRVLAISIASLAAAVIGNLYLGREAVMYAVLPWLLALVPAFLLAYFRGWRGATAALGLGMAVIAITEAVVIASGRNIYDGPLYAVVLLVYIGTSLAAGRMAELLHRQRIIAEKNAADVVTLLDEHGVIRYASPSAERVLGFSPEELIGEFAFDLVHPADRDHVQAKFTEGIQAPDAVVSIEYRFRHKDGSWRVLQGWGRNLLHERQIRAVLVSSRDVTGDREVRDHLTRLAAAVEAVGDGISIVDAEGRFVYVNNAQAAMYGAAGPADLVGRHWSILYSEEERKRFDREIMPVFAEAGKWYGNATGRRIDGSTFPQVISMTALEDGGLVCIDRDTTRQLELEQRLARAQRLESVGRLAGGIAHDFNNVLTAISGAAAFLKESLAPDDAELTDVQAIEEAAERARGLARQLLAFGRSQVMQPVALDLNEIVGETLRLLRRMIPANVDLDWTDEPELRVVEADPTQIQQLLINLVVNARDAMPEGGTVRIRVRNVDSHELGLEVEREIQGGAHVELVVADDGPGMDTETQQRLFEPFFTTKASGNGLGLATAYGIVRQSGGTIAVDSTPGEGAAFRVYLPAIERETSATEQRSRPAPLPREAGMRILLVEDDHAVRAIAERVLLRNGYVVTAANHAEAALRLVEGGLCFDLLITDAIMPGIPGWELARRLQSARPELPVLFISGYSTELSKMSELLENPSFLPKPFAPDELLTAVQRILPGAVSRSGRGDRSGALTRA